MRRKPGGDWLAPYPQLAAKLPKLDPALLAGDAIVGVPLALA